MARFLCALLTLHISSLAWAEEKLIFAIDLVRHGDRTPAIQSKAMQKSMTSGAMQLTPKGMRQSYELGQQLRMRYVDQAHLLPEHYDVNSMRVRASGKTRTMMTAQSILLGLYPLRTGPKLDSSTYALPEGFQPIPIDTVPREQDDLLIIDHTAKKHKQLLESYIYNLPEWIEKDKTLRPNYAYWSKVFGVKVEGLFDLVYLSDRLNIEKAYAIQLPNGLQENDAKVIKQAGEWAWLRMVNHPKFGQISGRKLAQTIKQEITLAAQEKRPLKYLLFVAHDTTLSAQLNLLGQQIDKYPPYVSDIQYALFDAGDSNYKVRVSYNQKLLYIKACGGTTCTLDAFVHLVDPANQG